MAKFGLTATLIGDTWHIYSPKSGSDDHKAQIKNETEACIIEYFKQKGWKLNSTSEVGPADCCVKTIIFEQ